MCSPCSRCSRGWRVACARTVSRTCGCPRWGKGSPGPLCREAVQPTQRAELVAAGSGVPVLWTPRAQPPGRAVQERRHHWDFRKSWLFIKTWRGWMKHRLQKPPRLMEGQGSGLSPRRPCICCQPCWQLLAQLPNQPRGRSRPHTSWAEGLSPHPGPRLSALGPAGLQKSCGRWAGRPPQAGQSRASSGEAAAWCEHQMWQICSLRQVKVTFPPFLRFRQETD